MPTSNDPFVTSEGATDAAPESFNDRLPDLGGPGRRSRRDPASPRLHGSEAPSHGGASPASPPAPRVSLREFVQRNRDKAELHAVEAQPAPCFKCGERQQIPKGKNVCVRCFRSPPSHPANYSDDCGCAWNYDRYVTLDLEDGGLKARPPDEHCVACQGSGRIKDNHRHLQIKRNIGATDGARGHIKARLGHWSPPRREDEELEASGTYSLSDGGWHSEKAGSTGAPAGRKASGVREPDVIWDALIGADITQPLRSLTPRGLREFNLSLFEWAEQDGTDEDEVFAAFYAMYDAFWPNFTRDVWDMKIAVAHQDKPLNMDALAKTLRAKNRSTAHRRKKRGERLVQQNSPKGGTDDMNAAAILSERLDRIERRLDEIQRDTTETVERLRERFPNNEEVAEAVETFLGEALSDAA